MYPNEIYQRRDHQILVPASHKCLNHQHLNKIAPFHPRFGLILGRSLPINKKYKGFACTNVVESQLSSNELVRTQKIDEEQIPLEPVVHVPASVEHNLSRQKVGTILFFPVITDLNHLRPAKFFRVNGV